MKMNRETVVVPGRVNAVDCSTALECRSVKWPSRLSRYVA